MPRLLGVYESELHPHFEAMLHDGVDVIVDVGCAEGYYAVGLARLAPGVPVYAHDIDPNARAACARLADLNGVSEQVIIGGEITAADLQAFDGRRVLLVVDIEGAEVDLLDPSRAPALQQMSMIVETHDVYRSGAEATIRARFEETHDIVRVQQEPKAFTLPPWMRDLNQLDQLLAVWEWRLQPTPWLVMQPRRRRAVDAR